MFSFHPKQHQQNFMHEWQKVFPPERLFFLGVTSAKQAQTICHGYWQLFNHYHASKHLGIIDQNHNSVLPYLTVKENILMSQENTITWRNEQPKWEQHAIERDFLEKSGKDLAPLDHFYIQFYRQIVGRKSVILVNMILDQLNPEVVREIIARLTDTLADTKATIIILTANQDLLLANPQDRLDKIPSFKIKTKK